MKDTMAVIFHSCVFAARGHAISYCAIIYNRCQLRKGINVIIQADAVWLQMQEKRAKIAVKNKHV